jgi:hypothetical protein
MTSSFVSLPRAAVLSIAITAFAASVAAAQTPTAAPVAPATQSTLAAPSFARLLEGKDVWITKADGLRRRGVVSSLSPDGIVLTGGGSATTILFDEIVKVEKTSHRLRKGTLIGLASGAGFGLVLGAVLCAEDGCDPAVHLAFGGLYGGLGAAAGVGIGALVNVLNRHGDVLYAARPRTTTMALSPILSRTHKSVAFSLSWR